MKTRLLPFPITAFTLVLAGCASHPDGKTTHKQKQEQQKFAATGAAFGGPRQGRISVSDEKWDEGSPTVGAVVCKVQGPLYGTRWRPYKPTPGSHPPKDNELIIPKPGITIPCNESVYWRAKFIADPPAIISWPYYFEVKGGRKTTITIAY